MSTTEDDELAELEEHRENVKDTLKVGSGADPLKALLDLDERVEDVEEVFPVPLVDGTKVDWTVRALGGNEIDEIQDRCTRYVKRGRGPKVQEMDSKKFNDLVVATATIAPNLDDGDLKQKYRVRHGFEVVGKVLLPGTVDQLTSKILEVSGYTDDLVDAGKA